MQKCWNESATNFLLSVSLAFKWKHFTFFSHFSIYFPMGISVAQFRRVLLYSFCFLLVCAQHHSCSTLERHFTARGVLGSCIRLIPPFSFNSHPHNSQRPTIQMQVILLCNFTHFSRLFGFGFSFLRSGWNESVNIWIIICKKMLKLLPEMLQLNLRFCFIC